MTQDATVAISKKIAHYVEPGWNASFCINYTTKTKHNTYAQLKAYVRYYNILPFTSVSD